QLDKHAAPYFYQHYFSNHFIWDHDFNRIKTNRVSGYITQRNLKLGADLTDVKDYVFIGADTLPAQYGENIRVLKAYLDQLFHFGKFDVNARLLYQKSSAEDVIRVPEFAGYFTITFNLKLFKGALNTRSGFDVYYFTKYYAHKYMPAIRSFYIQNEKEIGGFVHADFFLNFSVKRTRFFMKIQNFGSAIGENYYYQVPHYPLQDMAFKFGLSWRFHD
ncbi:MAG: putative porin, partial [Bacteroidales bacterium]